MSVSTDNVNIQMQRCTCTLHLYLTPHARVLLQEKMREIRRQQVLGMGFAGKAMAHGIALQIGAETPSIECLAP